MIELVKKSADRPVPSICQQIVKFMSFYIPKYVINLISGYSLGV